MEIISTISTIIMGFMFGAALVALSVSALNFGYKSANSNFRVPYWILIASMLLMGVACAIVVATGGRIYFSIG